MRVRSRVRRVEGTMDLFWKEEQCPVQAALRVLDQAQTSRSLGIALSKVAEARKLLEQVNEPVPISKLDLSMYYDEVLNRLIEILDADQQ